MKSAKKSKVELRFAFLDDLEFNFGSTNWKVSRQICGNHDKEKAKSDELIENDYKSNLKVLLQTQFWALGFRRTLLIFFVTRFSELIYYLPKQNIIFVSNCLNSIKADYFWGHGELLELRLLEKSARHDFIIARHHSSNNIFSCHLLESSLSLGMNWIRAV